MRRVLAAHQREHVGERVQLAGWLHRQRRLSRVSFLILRDRSGLGQVVVNDADEAERLAELPSETVLTVTGTVVGAASAPGGAELHHPEVEVVSLPAERPPLDLWRPSLSVALPTRLDLAPLALRHPRAHALFRVAAASIAGFRSALDDLGFTEIQTPKIVASATESGANVFAIDYFGRPAYLAQSPQFYKQAMVAVFERVYETGPVFRAEPHDTPRHLSEYVSLDAELGFIVDHTDVMAVARDAVAGMLESVRRRAGEAAALLALDVPSVPATIPAVHFSDAQAMIAANTGEDLAGEADLAPAHERWLGEWARREHGSDFVFVTGYPMAKRPFYTHPEPRRPEFSNSFDLIFRGLELITGGQRLHRYADYVDALRAAGQDPAAYEPYLQAFRFGMPPHGGFAIGLERWVSRLAGIANVRETTLFPRDRHRLTP
ncbi:MAG TPA: aspartate--tRNA(Asn) ligase [Solirubrobacteraceae bacterium]